MDRKTSWTIMLCIAADGTIANFAVESLKQINRAVTIPAGKEDEATVVVAVQFAIDAPGGQQVPRYIFDQHSGGSLGDSFAGYLDAPVGMTEQEALMSFLKWVHCHPKCNTAENYGLILWGHGPELLAQPPTTDPQNESAKLYLTPQELREALHGYTEKKKLGIVGFDACSMSMFEMAYELRNHADYMFASQESVPDLSFPYDSLISLFRQFGAQPEQLAREGLHAYIDSYQDYVFNAATGMNRPTISALRLYKCNDLKNAIEHLAVALLDAKKDPGLPNLLVAARDGSRDYAAGLYVDLVDFSTRLIKLLSIGNAAHVRDATTGTNAEVENRQVLQRMRKHRIITACKEVIVALMEDSKSNNPDLLVLGNSSADSTSHGVSLYFPYLSDAQQQVVNQPLVKEPLVKGGTTTHGLKGLPDVINDSNSSVLMSARRQIILDTEKYYKSLSLSLETGWYRFIVEQWSLTLATTAPDKLDIHYSAQQCAVNASRSCLAAGQHSPLKGCP